MRSFQATLSPAWASLLSLRFIYTVASLASPLESLMAIKTLHDPNGTSDSPPPAPKRVLCSIFLLHSRSSNTKPWSPSCPLSFSCKQHPIYHPIPVALPAKQIQKMDLPRHPHFYPMVKATIISHLDMAAPPFCSSCIQLDNLFSSGSQS